MSYCIMSYHGMCDDVIICYAYIGSSAGQPAGERPIITYYLLSFTLHLFLVLRYATIIILSHFILYLVWSNIWYTLYFINLFSLNAFLMQEFKEEIDVLLFEINYSQLSLLFFNAPYLELLLKFLFEVKFIFILFES